MLWLGNAWSAALFAIAAAIAAYELCPSESDARAVCALDRRAPRSLLLLQRDGDVDRVLLRGRPLQVDAILFVAPAVVTYLALARS